MVVPSGPNYDSVLAFDEKLCMMDVRIDARDCLPVRKLGQGLKDMVQDSLVSPINANP